MELTVPEITTKVIFDSPKKGVRIMKRTFDYGDKAPNTYQITEYGKKSAFRNKYGIKSLTRDSGEGFGTSYHLDTIYGDSFEIKAEAIRHTNQIYGEGANSTIRAVNNFMCGYKEVFADGKKHTVQENFQRTLEYLQKYHQRVQAEMPQKGLSKLVKLFRK